MSSFGPEVRVYLAHVVALLVPGRSVTPHQVVPEELAAVGSLEGWNDDDLALLIEESRRSLDVQHTRFDRLRTTAQVVLPLSIALLVIFGAALRRVVEEPTDWIRYTMYGAWALGASLVLLSSLGAAATLSVRSDFGSIMPTVLSQLQSPVRRELAKAYAQQAVVGETTVGTRITVVRDSVTLLALGAIVQFGLWLVDVLR